jgi:hypothetical protein
VAEVLCHEQERREARARSEHAVLPLEGRGVVDAHGRQSGAGEWIGSRVLEQAAELRGRSDLPAVRIGGEDFADDRAAGWRLDAVPEAVRIRRRPVHDDAALVQVGERVEVQRDRVRQHVRDRHPLHDDAGARPGRVDRGDELRGDTALAGIVPDERRDLAGPQRRARALPGSAVERVLARVAVDAVVPPRAGEVVLAGGARGAEVGGGDSRRRRGRERLEGERDVVVGDRAGHELRQRRRSECEQARSEAEAVAESHGRSSCSGCGCGRRTRGPQRRDRFRPDRAPGRVPAGPSPSAATAAGTESRVRTARGAALRPA